MKRCLSAAVDPVKDRNRDVLLASRIHSLRYSRSDLPLVVLDEAFANTVGSKVGLSLLT